MLNSASGSSNLARGYTIALICAAILSTTAIFIRYLTQTYHMPPLVLALWRDGLVAFTLLPVLGLLYPSLLRVNPRDLRYLTVYGLVLAIFNSLWTISVSLAGAAIATVLVYSSAAYTALLGWWLLKERLGWAKLLAVAFSLGGCVLVAGALDPAAWRGNPVGILTGILSGLCYAAYTLMGRSASQRGLNPWTTLLYTFGLAAVFLLLFNLLPGRLLPGNATHPADLFWLRDSLAGWGILLLLAAGPTVVGFGLYNVSLGYLPASVANLIVTLEPVFTTVIAYFLLGERLSNSQLGGSLMILAGVLFLRIYEGWLAGQAQSKERQAASV
ncbi:MAG: EamA family transporter [Firmicutes bacterium]|nr:EamA family transporter [Bacillota bacterium]